MVMRQKYWMVGLMALGAASMLLPVTCANAQAAPHHLAAREILAQLVSFRSAAGQGQLQATADYIVATARGGGVAEQDIVRLPLGETSAVLVRINGTDTGRPPVLFSAHFDVVDARPDDWQQDPFTLVERDGYLIGRGASDNKTGVTALVSAILRLRAAAVRPQRSLVFIFIGDEETEQATTRAVVQHPWVAGAAFAINTDAGGGMLSPDGRPLIYFIQGAEKTYATFRLTVRNPGGHSTVPRNDNAIYDLARALLRVESHQFPVMANALTRSFFAAVGRVEPGPIAASLRHFADDPTDAAALAAIRADPEYANGIATTCVATMAAAGHAENALPQRAEAMVNCRIFPGTAVADVQAQLRTAIGNDDVAVDVIGAPEESAVSELTPEVERVITASVHARDPGVVIAQMLMPGATDGLVYRRSGIPTFGTGGGFAVPGENFEHGLNERIRTRAFYAAVDHIHDLAIAFGR